TEREPNGHDHVVVVLSELGDVVGVVGGVHRLNVVNFRPAQRRGEHAFPRGLVEALVVDAADVRHQPDPHVAQIVLLAVDQRGRFNLGGGFRLGGRFFGGLFRRLFGYGDLSLFGGFLGCFLRGLCGGFLGGFLSRFLLGRSHRNRCAFLSLSGCFFGYFFGGFLSRFFGNFLGG